MKQKGFFFLNNQLNIKIILVKIVLLIKKHIIAKDDGIPLKLGALDVFLQKS